MKTMGVDFIGRTEHTFEGGRALFREDFAEMAKSDTVYMEFVCPTDDGHDLVVGAAVAQGEVWVSCPECHKRLMRFAVAPRPS